MDTICRQQGTTICKSINLLAERLRAIKDGVDCAELEHELQFQSWDCPRLKWFRLFGSYYGNYNSKTLWKYLHLQFTRNISQVVINLSLTSNVYLSLDIVSYNFRVSHVPFIHLQQTANLHLIVLLNKKLFDAVVTKESFLLVIVADFYAEHVFAQNNLIPSFKYIFANNTTLEWCALLAIVWVWIAVASRYLHFSIVTSWDSSSYTTSTNNNNSIQLG